MREITISIKPNLRDISDPSRLAKLIGEIATRFEENVDMCLEAVATRILEMAKQNAETGYSGRIEFAGKGESPVWQQRSEITRELYRLSPFHEEDLSGLDTGARRLIGSLERGDPDNIFNVHDNIVEFGTSFKHAHILEHGGVRSTEDHIGFTGDLHMKRWLRKLVEDEVITMDDVERMRRELQGQQIIPSRPFLGPALWFARDEELHTRIVAHKMVEQVFLDIKLEARATQGGSLHE